MATMTVSEQKSNNGPLGALKKRISMVRGGRKTKSAYKEVAVVDAPQTRALFSSNDVLCGGAARSVAQATVHPLDTLKVRMQTSMKKAPTNGKSAPQVVSQAQGKMAQRVGGHVKVLYRGVGSAAGGAGIAIGAYFAFYGAATKFLQEQTDMPVGAVAFAAGGMAAFGSAYVKVPLAVTIRSVQAGVYANPVMAAKHIIAKAGVRGLFTGLVPTILEDIPDMAVKFASYEMLRATHARMTDNRNASVQEDLVMGGCSGALAAACTTPFDVVKTRMMCDAASRPGVIMSARTVYAQGGPRAFFSGVGPRTASNAINSALFFCLFEAFRQAMKEKARREETQLVNAVSYKSTGAPVEASLSKSFKAQK